MNYALIGCGRVAPNHIKAAKENGLSIVAVCDIEPAHITELFERTGLTPQQQSAIHCYTDYIQMLQNEDLELVSIALPSGLHAQCALQVIEHNINVIIEKPIAMSLSDADSIIAAGKVHGVKVCACHQNRFNKAVQQMRTALETGRFGTLSHAAVTVRWHRDWEYYSQADWRGKWASDGGTLMNQCIHGIDLLRWMCGDEITSVYGVTKRTLHPYIQAEDIGTAVITFANGAVATVEGTVNVAGNDLEEHLSLFGSTGAVKLGGTCANTVEHWYFDDNPLENKDGFHEQALNVYGNGHTALFADMIAAIRDNREPYVSAEAGKRALETVLAIYQSSFTGQRVDFPVKSINSTDFEGFFKP